MRTPVVIAVALGLAACAPAVPDSGAGAGFQDYNSYMREREASAGRMPAGQPVAPLGQAPTGFSTDIASAAIDRATGATPVAPNQPAFSGQMPLDPTQGQVIGTQAGTLDANRPRGNAPTTIQAESGEMQPRTGTISDENDFAAVSARETIESDKARIERNRAQYTVIQPEALPQRSGESGPNIVDYALATQHAPGTKMHSRSSLRFTDPNVACARYTSSDLAQEAFLANGGPEKDRRGLDPDGDGFACAWDPRPFRAALQ
jgi:hypothetical protein